MSRPGHAEGDALMDSIGRGDVAATQKAVADGAFVGKKELAAALQSGNPAIYGELMAQAATKPQPNDCLLIRTLLDGGGSNAYRARPLLNGDPARDAGRLELLDRFLLGEAPPAHCEPDVVFNIFRDLWVDRSSVSLQIAERLFARKILKADATIDRGMVHGTQNLLGLGSEELRTALHRHGDSWKQRSELMLVMINATPSLAGFDAQVLVRLSDFHDANPMRHRARMQVLQALVAKGLAPSLTQIGKVREARDRVQDNADKALQFDAMLRVLERARPELAGEERHLQSQRALLAAFREHRSGKDGGLKDAEAEARIAHLIRRGSNPNHIEYGGEAGFDEWRYRDHCKVFTHKLIDQNSLEIARALVETYRDELVAGVDAVVKGNCAGRWEFNLVEQALWPTDSPSRHDGKRESLALYLLEQGILVKEPLKALTGAAEQGYQQLAAGLIAKGASLDEAFKQLAARGNLRALNVLAAAGGEQGRVLLVAYQREQQRLQAERARRAAEAEAAQARREAAEQARIAQLARKKKHVGDSVCNDGAIAFGLLSVRIHGFVEGINGDRIQIRIADTGGQTIRYQGVDLRQNTLLWDERTHWLHCQI